MGGRLPFPRLRTGDTHDARAENQGVVLMADRRKKSTRSSDGHRHQEGIGMPLVLDGSQQQGQGPEQGSQPIRPDQPVNDFNLMSRPLQRLMAGNRQHKCHDPRRQNGRTRHPLQKGRLKDQQQSVAQSLDKHKRNDDSRNGFHILQMPIMKPLRHHVSEDWIYHQLYHPDQRGHRGIDRKLYVCNLFKYHSNACSRPTLKAYI